MTNHFTTLPEVPQEIIRNSDGWYSRDGGMSWNNPNMSGAAPQSTGYFKSVTIGMPRIVENPLEKHIQAIREEYRALDQQHGTCSITIKALTDQIAALKQDVDRYKQLASDRQATLEAIRGHLK